MTQISSSENYSKRMLHGRQYIFQKKLFGKHDQVNKGSDKLWDDECQGCE